MTWLGYRKSGKLSSRAGAENLYVDILLLKGQFGPLITGLLLSLECKHLLYRISKAPTLDANIYEWHNQEYKYKGAIHFITSCAGISLSLSKQTFLMIVNEGSYCTVFGRDRKHLGAVVES
jgi:hypothetical protein